MQKRQVLENQTNVQVSSTSSGALLHLLIVGGTGTARS